MARLKVTLKKSVIGAPKDHKATAAALGLRRLNAVRYHDDTPQVMGMIRKVRYLLDVEAEG